MSNKAKKYDYCPFCKDVQLAKAVRRKHVWQCPICGFTIAPNWRKGRFERLTKTFQANIKTRELAEKSKKE
jgi:ribosomal protein L37AE/L43A